ncbi:Golgi transport complex subunit 3 [Desmophyllum pertusum]|uniref:Golgi transport complex subunit 3 n=1 Tax=Desmophyllum pertusum TaxID=174260 RepID=A0A9X0CE89_9CNID|nr:Golgi transport complex subunit 3 [Desmophyllum pertusum]
MGAIVGSTVRSSFSLHIPIQVEMIEDHVQQKGAELAAFEVVILQMMEDVQERLVYRAQAYIETDIQKYSPAPGGFGLPRKTYHWMPGDPDREEKQAEGEEKKSMEVTSSFSRPAGHVVPNSQAHFGVSLKALPLYFGKDCFLDWKETFEGLSQEALSLCIQSLKTASALIAQRKDAINGHLFLIKHLLILREQIAPFDVDFCRQRNVAGFQ